MNEPQQPRKLGLTDAYSLQTPDDNRALYRDWAATYDDDFIDSNGYVYHENVAALFAHYARDRSEPVLDVGCGTGVVGLALQRHGYTTIDGIDISPEMLGQSAEKGVYRNLVEADLTQTIDLASDTYAAMVSVGTFTHGHLGPEALRELFRIAAPGCRFVVGINTEHYASHGFDAWFRAASKAKAISAPQIEMVRIFSAADTAQGNEFATVVLCTKLD